VVAERKRKNEKVSADGGADELRSIYSKLDVISNKLDKITNAIASTSTAYTPGAGSSELIEEKNGVQLIRLRDYFGTYVIIDNTGETHEYATKKSAMKAFEIIASKAP